MSRQSRVLSIPLFLFCVVCVSNSYASRPSHIYERQPSGVHLAYDSLNVPVPGGARLTAWLCKPQKLQTDALIILAGPDAGNMSDQLDIAQSLVENLGIRVLLFDYEGFGTSSATPIDTDAIAMPVFAADLHGVARYVSATLGVDTNRIVIYGRSMGASLALTVSSLYGGCGGVVAESPYASQSSVARACTELYKRNGTNRKVVAIPDRTLEPLEVAAACRASLLLIRGANEDLIPSSEICDLYEKCGSKKKSLWIAAGARHLEVPYNEMGTFLNAVFSLLNNLDGMKK